MNPGRLVLQDIALDEGDLRCIGARKTSLQSLHLVGCKDPSYPAGALPALAALPHLRNLSLDVRAVVQMPREEVAEALQQLCAGAAPRRLNICLDGEGDDELSCAGLSWDGLDDYDSDDDEEERDGEPGGVWNGGVIRREAERLRARTAELLSGAGLSSEVSICVPERVSYEELSGDEW
ncbi:hypothetical protein GPECTOR_49g526 [Gonium pectorale]|uniref:Uncharacterized protein n=1 Tax=Gonium pectorale TaxID=33097 RepID=A0A150G7X2_GONPE|nr:hypothetical protein GPECTOR_49g526 [Gonium pectorale]|eukprot:KXZ45942.1 hypothetical protein GPECTOR_49g526 [Gonium pectorale]